MYLVWTAWGQWAGCQGNELCHEGSVSSRQRECKDVVHGTISLEYCQGIWYQEKNCSDFCVIGKDEKSQYSKKNPPNEIIRMDHLARMVTMPWL